MSAVLISALALTASNAAAKPVAADRWATSACGAVAAWQAALLARVQSTTTLDVPRLEARLVAADLKAEARLTARLVRRLDAAGDPKVVHGSELAAALRSAFDTARQAIAAAQVQLAQVDTSSDAAFIRGITTIQQQVTDGFAAAQRAVADAGSSNASPSLDAVLARTRACKRLAQ